jgi:hypothetical protein
MYDARRVQCDRDGDWIVEWDAPNYRGEIENLGQFCCRWHLRYLKASLADAITRGKVVAGSVRVRRDR